MSKKTLVIGASLNPERYSNKAINALVSKGHEVVAYGLREGEVATIPITTDLPKGGFDTVTLYLNPSRQKEYYQYIIKLNPKRVIFNPGTENQEFKKLLKEAKIHTEIACTLVLLSIGNY